MWLGEHLAPPHRNGIETESAEPRGSCKAEHRLRVAYARTYRTQQVRHIPMESKGFESTAPSSQVVHEWVPDVELAFAMLKRRIGFSGQALPPCLAETGVVEHQEIAKA